MRYTSYFLVALAVFNFSAHAGDSILNQSTPQAVITYFFSALKTDDEETLIKLLAPRRKYMAGNADSWKHWLSVWHKCEVVGFAGERESTSSKYDETIFISVEYKCVNRPNFKDEITLSRVGKIWYWDEN